MTRYAVRVAVATVWTSPDAPRPVDAPAVADEPDLTAWTDALDAAARLGLHGRTLTQLLADEPVQLVEAGPPGWVKVRAPWQPIPGHPDGYPGWIRAAHLGPPVDDSIGEPAPVTPAVAPERLDLLTAAREFLGLRYLWGGMSRWGLDCSGLVHYCHRMAGVVVPRDADAQHIAAAPVPLGGERPGDLYFFATEGRVHHVGFVTSDGQVLHAPEGGGGAPGEGRIEESPLAADRRATLVGAGTFLSH